MSLKSLFDNGETIYRVLAENDSQVVVIDCLKRTMPFWIPKDVLSYLCRVLMSNYCMKKQVYIQYREESSQETL